MQKKLCDCCDFYAGTGFPEIYQGNSEGEFPFYKVGDISSNVIAGNVYLNHCENYISKNVVSLIRGIVIPAGTVVFAKIGEALKKNRRAITKTDCLVDNNAMGIAPHTNLLRTKYFYYFMLALKMEKYAEATAVPSVRKTRLEQVSIYIPTIEQQTQIETLLDSLSTVISLRQRQLRTLDELIKARFVELSAIWEREVQPEHLYSYLEEITYGFTNPMPDSAEGPWKVTAKDVVDGHVNYDTARKTTQEAYDSLTSKSKPTIGSVLLTKDGTLGRTAIVENDNICVNQSVAVLKTNPRILPRFLEVLLRAPVYQSEMLKDAGGGTIKHIYITKVDKMKVTVPDLEEQRRFLFFVSQVDKSKAVVHAALDEAQLLFDRLMQQYFG